MTNKPELERLEAGSEANWAKPLGSIMAITRSYLFRILFANLATRAKSRRYPKCGQDIKLQEQPNPND